MSTCAACGKGGDGLKACTGCGQVKYCNNACRKAHYKTHKKQCRQQRAGKKLATNDVAISCSNIDALSDEMNRIVISDDELFKDPPPKEDCPICFLPMPYSSGACDVQQVYQPCCGKKLCSGCKDLATDEMRKGTIKGCCPFCRKPLPNSEELLQRYKKRMEAGDAEAFLTLGSHYEDGSSGRLGLQQNREKAVELWSQAAKLGSVEAQFRIANSHYNGQGVAKDIDRAIHYWKLAAIGGHESARNILGNLELNNDMNNAMKHFMIAARAGYDKSLQEVGEGYTVGLVPKDEYASVLRAHKDSRDEMKSEQRSKVAGKYQGLEALR